MMHELTIHQQKQLLEKGELSSVELIQACFNEIDKSEPQIGAWISTDREKALQMGAEIDGRRVKGEPVGYLAGIPTGVKDNLCTTEMKTTCGSKMLAHYISPYNATVVEKLHEADAVILGKLNMDEFAMGSSTENSHFKPTHNPRDLSCVPGGSSGGSAAAVAANHLSFSLGSDTGGSVRQPAAFCGIVGLKPTYGAVSRYGLVAFASSLDQVGPLTKDVRDMAYVMNAIVGHDKRDSTSSPHVWGDLTEALVPDVKGLRIALPIEYFTKGVSEDVKVAVLNAAKAYEAMGAIVEEVHLNTMAHALPAYYIISSAEASSNLARFDGVEYGYRAENFEDLTDLYIKSRSQGFGKEVKRRILLGTYTLSSGYYDAYYKKALQVRSAIHSEFEGIFSKFDLIISPVAPTTAWKMGEKSKDPLEMYMEDIYTVPINIAGVPAISVPCGVDGRGLPIGMQLIGKHFDEKTLLRAAYTYEQACAKERW